MAHRRKSRACVSPDYFFSAKLLRDLEIWVRGHSRSFKMVPFKSLSIATYSHSMATEALSYRSRNKVIYW